MAATAAWGRGGSDVERALIVALSVAVVLAVHLLPAINRRWAGWVLWSCCLLAAVFAHLVFFTQASVHAGGIRGQQSARFTGTVQQIEAAQAALDGIRARPVAVIAAEVAATDSWRQRRALEIEIQEAYRAAALRDAVLRLSAEAVSARVADSTDPTTDRIAAATGACRLHIAGGRPFLCRAGGTAGRLLVDAGTATTKPRRRTQTTPEHRKPAQRPNRAFTACCSGWRGAPNNLADSHIPTVRPVACAGNS
jgi:hypothetical protein